MMVSFGENALPITVIASEGGIFGPIHSVSR